LKKVAQHNFYAGDIRVNLR